MSKFSRMEENTEQFVQDVDRLLAGQPTTVPADDPLQADLELARLLGRLRFGTTPSFEFRLRSRLQNRLHAKEEKMKRTPRSLLRPILAAGLIVIVAFAVLLVASPSLRVAAQDVLRRFFVEVESPWSLISPSTDSSSPRTSPGQPNPQPGAGVNGGVKPPDGVSVPPAPVAGLQSDQMLVSVEEAQAATNLTIKLPAALPEGYNLKGVLKPFPVPQVDQPPPAEGPVTGMPATVLVVFENDGGEKLLLGESTAMPAQDANPQIPVGQGSVQEVTVRGQPAQYIQGAWSPQGWDPNARYHQLHWQGTDGLTYDLVSGPLELEALLKVAESIP
jgi:hypothetical protein